MLHIYSNASDRVSRYAAQELARVIGRITREKIMVSGVPEGDSHAKIDSDTPQTSLSLKVSTALSEQEIEIVTKDGSVTIAGGSPAALLSGVYCFLEALGCLFEFSGEVLPEIQDSLAIPDMDLRHVPSFKQRGIRMHLNFVQDQSFFTQEAFGKFIDDLPKQKMNYLMFHMYTSQAWYPFTYRGVKHLELELGNLRRQSIDPAMIGRDKIKVRDHWFPADLEHITDPEELMTAVYHRYRDMMERCHERGISTAASIEPEALPELFETKLEEWSGSGLDSLMADRDLSNSWQEGWSGRRLVEPDITHPLMTDIAVERCLQLIEAFPELDELQLISREGTSWTPKEDECFESELERLTQKFSIPHGVLDFEKMSETVQPNEGPEMHAKAHPYWTVLPGANYFAAVTGSLRFVEFALEILKDQRLQDKLSGRSMTASVALYSPNPTVIQLVMPVIAKMLPEGTRFHCLADYGARDIADNMTAWQPLCDHNHKAGLISWLEFDGNMALAQCWAEGIGDNLRKAHELGIQTAYFNHWRVRSLEHNAAMAARLCWDIADTKAFEAYAASVYGSRCREEALSAYRQLEEATVYAKARNYNIGFTNDWVYQHSTDAPGYYWGYLLQSQMNFQKSALAFDRLRQICQNAYGKRQASYMKDLCAISAMHIEAVQHLQNAKLPLMGYKAWPLENEHSAWPNPDALKHYAREARTAYELELEYMKTYSQWVEGCDEQGQLVMHQQGVIEPFGRFAAVLEEMVKEQRQVLYRLTGRKEQEE